MALGDLFRLGRTVHYLRRIAEALERIAISLEAISLQKVGSGKGLVGMTRGKEEGRAYMYSDEEFAEFEEAEAREARQDERIEFPND